MYLNKNGNLAIEKSVLEEFLKVSYKTIVWVRPKQFWRMRQPSDPADRREVKG